MTIALIVYSMMEYYFIKAVYSPSQPVKSDPYWEAIYRVKEEHSNLDIKEERKKQMIQADNEVEIPTSNGILEVSTDLESEEIIEELQKEFSGDTLSLFTNHPEPIVDDSKCLDIESLTQKEPTADQTMLSYEIKEPQLWYVNVVGKEGPFLHVSDGKKKWVHVGNEAKKVAINDLLFLTVQVKEEERIEVKDLTILQH